jgi:hypothetical protein
VLVLGVAILDNRAQKDLRVLLTLLLTHPIDLKEILSRHGLQPRHVAQCRIAEDNECRNVLLFGKLATELSQRLK